MPSGLLFLLALLTGSIAEEDRRLVYSYDGSDRQVDWDRFADVFPFLVSLQFETSSGTTYHICGGTIIRDRWVLTAAHCLKTAKSFANDYQVWSLASRDQNAWDKKGVDLIVVHPEYDMDSLDNDIALLRLPESLPNVPLVQLESSEARHNGSQALLAGWGSIDEACMQYEFILKEGDSHIVGGEPCALGSQFFNWTERICTEHINATGKDMAGAGCGDSGGPLFVKESGELMQVGVVSHTAAGRDVFTRVFTYLDWINDVMSSPPADHMMIPPRCHGSCCDDGEYLDRWSEECWTWQDYDCDPVLGGLPNQERVELLDKCKATCMRCPLCEATNSSCCDTVGFRTGNGHLCTQWVGTDCTTATSQYGYQPADMAELIENCPFSCGTCRAGTDCTDTAYFADPYGYRCDGWKGYDCTQAVEVFSYAQEVEDMVLKHCPLSCGSCTPLSSTVSVTSSTASTSSSSTAATSTMTTSTASASPSSTATHTTTTVTTGSTVTNTKTVTMAKTSGTTTVSKSEEEELSSSISSSGAAVLTMVLVAWARFV